jgi:hypothetical protein
MAIPYAPSKAPTVITTRPAVAPNAPAQEAYPPRLGVAEGAALGSTDLVGRADIDADSGSVVEVPVAPHPATIAIVSRSPNVNDGGLDGDQVID